MELAVKNMKSEKECVREIEMYPWLWDTEKYILSLPPSPHPKTHVCNNLVTDQLFIVIKLIENKHVYILPLSLQLSNHLVWYVKFSFEMIFFSLSAELHNKRH